MKSKIITFPEKQKWNDFVAASPFSSVLQSYEWGELKSRFGWHPIRIALEDNNNNIVAGISLLKREIPFIRHSFLYAPRGPIVDLTNQDLVHELLEVVEKEAERNHALSLKIDPEIPESYRAGKNILEPFGFIRSAKQVQPRATMIVDIQPDLNLIMASFEEKTRYNIRLAEKKGVIVKEERSEKGIDLFYESYIETAKRDKFIIHPKTYYQRIREIMFSAGLGTTFIAYKDDKAIAGVIIFAFGGKIWYMYGASSALFRNLMPNHLLHWEIIKWGKERGYKEYDLWGIPANPKEGHPLFGVYRFKKGFNGKLVKYIGAYDFPYSPLFYYPLEYAMTSWQNIRSLIKKGKISDSLGE
ncbi:MAG: peptidoglycan bridge formation glycyltransferase FemA/FemB family protein [Candidatus Margulisiibacteriota bacterium]